MPGQERVGAHDRSDLAKCSATQVLRLGSQQNALVVRESQRSRSELLSEHAILGLEIVDHLALLLVDPAGQGDKEKLNGCEPGAFKRPEYQRATGRHSRAAAIDSLPTRQIRS